MTNKADNTLLKFNSKYTADEMLFDLNKKLRVYKLNDDIMNSS